MYKLYSRIDDHETILECWGASTKHPDSSYHFSAFVLSDWVEPQFQILPWVLECASRLILPSQSYRLTKWILKIYEAGL